MSIGKGLKPDDTPYHGLKNHGLRRAKALFVNIPVLNTRTIQRADPSLIPNAVEKCLRFETSVPTWCQVTAKATKIGDIELPEGARLYVALCSANH